MDIREWILGSDVNIVRFVDEQNGGDKNIRDRKIFNDIISYMGLINLLFTNRQSTWST